jgi:hypothetical protein
LFLDFILLSFQLLLPTLSYFTMSAASVDKREVNHFDDDSPSAIEKAVPQSALNKDIDFGFAPEVVKKLTRKIDHRLIPVLSMMYGISLIDRTNLAIARAANDGYMNTELGLKDNDRYSIITLIFFVPYIILEIPVS